MKKIYLTIFILGILALGIGYYIFSQKSNKNTLFQNETAATVDNKEVFLDNNLSQNRAESPDDSGIEVVAENLNIPWSLVFLPDGSMLVTERPGVLKKIGTEEFSIKIPDVVHIGEGGLLGITLHPNFKENNWLYLYFTTRTNGRMTNVVKRYTLSGNNIGEEKIIIVGIPGNSNHNGGRIKFGPDGLLYITTGDSETSSLAQDINSLAGKILRLDENGDIPSDNPFGNAVYSYGHRNPQGLTWDEQGRLWATEHGRSGVQSGLDELNLIERGANYGWPTIQGDQAQDDLKSPVRHSGATATWAPSGLAYHSGSVFFAGLRGQALYEMSINEQGTVNEIKSHFKNEFGRLRDVVIGPDGYFYLLTSNTDGRGNPKSGDDKIIKISEKAIRK